MNAPTMDELVLLPEGGALQRYFDSLNYRIFLWILGLCGACSLIALAAALGRGETFAPALLGVNVFLSLALFAARQEPFFARFVRQIILAYVLFQLVMPTTLRWGDGTVSLIVLLPLLLIGLRLRAIEYLFLYGATWVATLWKSWAGDRPANVETKPWHLGGYEAAVTAGLVVFLLLALVLTQRGKRQFLSVYRRESSRHRERQRMREEIDQARRVQLSMLPQKAPELAWLEVAAASLPAAEVGGDYYEFFPLGPDRLAAVIGDVAGHGLGSGLILSGLRSCLFLLEDELIRPVPVFERINRMVRRTTGRRSFVTLACAVLDRNEGVARIATAGHPPVLVWSKKTRSVETVGSGSPPLGTNLPVSFGERLRPIGPGDLLVLYTDGLIEARNAADHEYGEERLIRLVDQIAASSSARDLRDSILGDLANFKGDCEQLDDMTVVVLRWR